MLKRILLWALAFVLPLAAYFGYVGFESLSSFDGRCMGLLDTEGSFCTKPEFVFDYFFNGFTGGFTLFIIIGWGFVLSLAAFLVHISKVRHARSAT